MSQNFKPRTQYFNIFVTSFNGASAFSHFLLPFLLKYFDHFEPQKTSKPPIF